METRKVYHIFKADCVYDENGTLLTVNGDDFETAAEWLDQDRNTLIKTFSLREALNYIKDNNIKKEDALIEIYNGFEEDGEIEFSDGADFDDVEWFYERMSKLVKSQNSASKKYDAKNTKQIHLKLNLDTDSDILEHLDGCGNKQGFIKDAIRTKIKAKQ